MNEQDVKSTLYFYNDRNDIPKVSLSNFLFRDSFCSTRIKSFAKGEIKELYLHSSMIREHSPNLPSDKFNVVFVSESEFKAADIKAGKGWIV